MVFSRAQLSEEERAEVERKAIKANRVIDIVFFIPVIAVTALLAACAVCVGAGIFRLVLFGLWALFLLVSIKKGRTGSFLLAVIAYPFVAFILLIILYMPGGFSSGQQWKYNFQRKYVDLMQNGRSDCFPDELPKELSEYEITYLPSVMQGTGHFRVRFRTSPQQLEEYEKEYSEQAIYTIPLTNIRSDWMTGVKEVSPKAKVGMENDRTLFIAFDNEFWEGHDEDATVYVTYAVHNFNHPHSGAVIINKKEGMVEFTHFG